MNNIFEFIDVVHVSEEYLRDFGYMRFCECGRSVQLEQCSDTRTRKVGATRVTDFAQHCYAGTCLKCGKVYRSPIKQYKADSVGRLQLVKDGDNGSEPADDDDAATSEAGGVVGGVASAS